MTPFNTCAVLPPALWQVLDFVEGGELMSWDESAGKFTSNEGGLFTEARAAKATQDVISGLAYLHMNHIAHRDLKVCRAWPRPPHPSPYAPRESSPC
mmetsp:Transcript_96818/g.276691  ORF Transcript_96818/g.276691 Transcript_96818/m.276691 type:complete len:97 (+) Transcript_96818:867-1157(+)